jgi:hypothetical protein
LICISVTNIMILMAQEHGMILHKAEEVLWNPQTQVKRSNSSFKILILSLSYTHTQTYSVTHL